MSFLSPVESSIGGLGKARLLTSGDRHFMIFLLVTRVAGATIVGMSWSGRSLLFAEARALIAPQAAFPEYNTARLSVKRINQQRGSRE